MLLLFTATLYVDILHSFDKKKRLSSCQSKDANTHTHTHTHTHTQRSICHFCSFISAMCKSLILVSIWHFLNSTTFKKHYSMYTFFFEGMCEHASVCVVCVSMCLCMYEFNYDSEFKLWKSSITYHQESKIELINAYQLVQNWISQENVQEINSFPITYK